VSAGYEYLDEGSYMCLILLVSATLFAGCASRGAGATVLAADSRAAAGPPAALAHGLLAVDSLWSTGGRATGPAIRTPADGPGRSRPAP
jgi:hypothetical protein